MQNKQRGFTLIEIIVVMLIIGILAVAVGPQILGRVDDAKVVKVKQDMHAIESALNLYRLDKSNYPSTDEGLAVLKGKYLPRVPKDPWGKEYLYLFPGQNGEFDLFTRGADGADGGEGANKDLGNWNIDS